MSIIEKAVSALGKGGDAENSAKDSTVPAAPSADEASTVERAAGDVEAAAGRPRRCAPHGVCRHAAVRRGMAFCAAC